MMATKIPMAGKMAGRLACMDVQATPAVTPACISDRSGHLSSTSAVAALIATAAMIGFQIVAESARSNGAVATSST